MSEREFLVIEQKYKGEESNVIAKIPFEGGSYSTEKGTLHVDVFPPDSMGLQKVVFKGGVIPTIQQRGQAHYERNRKMKGRRVVDFPENPNRHVSQDVGANGRLIFRRQTIHEPESLAAD